MATVPDRQPFGIGVVGYTGGPVGLLLRTGVTAAVGLAGISTLCERGTEPCPPDPGGDDPGAGEAQDTVATDSSTHTVASRAAAPLSGPINDHPSPVGGSRRVPVTPDQKLLD